MSSCIHIRLRKLFKNALPSVKLNLIYKTTYRMGNMFRYKDQFPASIRSDFIYLYKCGLCNESYIGLSRRHQKVRFSEHMLRSARTGNVLNSDTMSKSAVSDHMISTNHEVSNDNFTILSIGGNQETLEIKESLMIHKLKPSLNSNTFSTVLYLFN